MTNTKARHLEIYNAAVQILEKAGGVEVFDALPQLERVPNLLQMAKEVVKITDCHIDSAKRNVTKALRKGRWALMQKAPEPNNWGGIRN